MEATNQKVNWMKHLTFDNVFKVGTLVGLAAILWLNAHYVTKENFEQHCRDQSEFQTGISQTLAGVATSIALLQANGERLTDHEARIRYLERMKP